MKITQENINKLRKQELLLNRRICCCNAYIDSLKRKLQRTEKLRDVIALRKKTAEVGEVGWAIGAGNLYTFKK